MISNSFHFFKDVCWRVAVACPCWHPQVYLQRRRPWWPWTWACSWCRIAQWAPTTSRHRSWQTQPCPRSPSPSARSEAWSSGMGGTKWPWNQWSEAGFPPHSWSRWTVQQIEFRLRGVYLTFFFFSFLSLMIILMKRSEYLYINLIRCKEITKREFSVSIKLTDYW